MEEEVAVMVEKVEGREDLEEGGGGGGGGGRRGFGILFMNGKRGARVR